MQKRDDGLSLHSRAVNAALLLADQTSPLIPSLAAVAEEIEVPLGQIETIFPNPNAMLVAACEDALVRLIDAVSKAVVRVDPGDAVGQFEALGKAYIAWAACHPMQFRLMCDHRLVDPQHVPQLSRYLDALFALMTRMVQRAKDDGMIAPDEDVDLIVLSCRSFAYGLSRMVIDNRIAEMHPTRDPVAVAENALCDFIRRMAISTAHRVRQNWQASAGGAASR